MAMQTDTSVVRRKVAPELHSGPSRDLVRCGAELVEVAERFYCGIFTGVVVFVGVAALAALVLLPLRESKGPPVVGVIGAGLLVAVAPLALRRATVFYRALRRHVAVQLGLVLYAAALVAVVFPLKSQLWWPSCTLLMLLAVVVPLGRVLAYCFIVLMANLLAHIISGDLTQGPAVTVIGLWIGYIFWSSTVAMISDQLAAVLLRLNAGDVVPMSAPRRFSPGYLICRARRSQIRIVQQASTMVSPTTGGRLGAAARSQQSAPAAASSPH